MKENILNKLNDVEYILKSNDEKISERQQLKNDILNAIIFKK